MRKLINALAEVKTWMANGQGYFNDFKYPILGAVSLKVFFPDAGYGFLIAAALLGILVLIFVGWLDLRFIQLHQRTMEIQTERYNPYFSRLFKKVTRRKA